MMRPAILFVLAAVPAAGSEESLELVRRALPFVREQGIDWIENRECASCHQVPSMLWSMNLAAGAGLEVDRDELLETTAWAADWRHWNKTGDKEGEGKVSAGNIDTMAFLLLGRDPARDGAAEWVERFRASLLAHQQADGSWKPGGQLPLGKRPERETREVTTMWTLLALAGTGTEGLAEAKARAEAFLAAATPGQSTEWHALRLLLAPEDAARREALLQCQGKEGGWGWLVAEPGDALGTGIALFALARSGLPEDHEAWLRGVAFLAKTQRADGSWAVPSTRQRDANKTTRTATDWGTAWAAIGLLEPKAAAREYSAVDP